MSEFHGFAFRSDDRNVFFFIKNKKKIEDLNYSSFVLFETDCVTQADLPRAFGCQAYAPLLLAHL